MHDVERSHQPLDPKKLSQDLGDRHVKIPITNLELLVLTLEQNLPFSFADSPHFGQSPPSLATERG
jgi:hypothetical protein